LTNYATHSDEQLLNLLKEGNHLAFEEIYHRYWNNLFAVALVKSFHNHYNAQEVLQRVFIKFWKKRESLELRYSLYSYLATAIHYELLDMAVEDERFSRTFEYADPNQQTSFNHRLDLADLEKKISIIVERLPHKAKIVFKMSREDHRTYRQIASELGVTEKTVEAHISLALRKLRTGLGNIFSFLLF
jgi:RNA polymerase sigma factor (sigma-70 family)